MSISYYYGLLKEKEEQIRRLNESSTRLQNVKQELSNYKPSISNPPLSASLWQGSLANTFDQIRREGILQSYQDIESTQFATIFSQISEKVSSLQSEVVSIRQTIAYLEAELAREREESKSNG